MIAITLVAIVIGTMAGCGTAAPAATTAALASTESATPAVSAAAATPAPTAIRGIGRIAFVTGGTEENEVIVTILPDGTDAWRVPRPGPSMNEGPAWVPGTEILVFDSTRTGSVDLYRIKVGDAAATPITATVEGFEGYPSVSPDGKTIVFDNGTATESLGLWLMDFDGSNQRPLVAPPKPPTFDSAPAFSPDGTQVAFVRKRSQQSPNAQEAAFVVNLDGSGLVQLNDWSLDVGRVRWAPDGSHLVLSDSAENTPVDGSVDVWRVDPDGSNLRRVTENQAGTYSFSPDYSPDGSRLLFAEWHSGWKHNELWTSDPDGSNRQMVYASPDGFFIEWPVWGGSH